MCCRPCSNGRTQGHARKEWILNACGFTQDGKYSVEKNGASSGKQTSVTVISFFALSRSTGLSRGKACWQASSLAGTRNTCPDWLRSAPADASAGDNNLSLADGGKRGRGLMTKGAAMWDPLDPLLVPHQCEGSRDAVGDGRFHHSYIGF